MKLIAFDPGLKGGIAYESPCVASTRIEAIPMPVSGKEIDIAAIAGVIKVIRPDMAIIEKVHSMPGQGVSSTFKFGMGYGALLGICSALEIRTELVTPQRWKSVTLRGTKKDKDAAIAYCRRAFPSTSLLATARSKKPHDGMADALCIYSYGQREFNNLLVA